MSIGIMVTGLTQNSNLELPMYSAYAQKENSYDNKLNNNINENCFETGFGYIICDDNFDNKYEEKYDEGYDNKYEEKYDEGYDNKYEEKYD
ncbi:MAG: hypothetical protein ACE5SW_09105, partial [Nitrososphaeraceae archaeon]